MSILLVVIGAALVCLVFLDALSTTLWVDSSAGPVSSRVAAWSWRRARSWFGHRHRTLSLVGPFLLSFIVFLWIAMLWIGWTLIFSWDTDSVLHATTSTPADRVARVYFVGYLLFTAGLGDYVPNGDLWQVMAVLTNLTGLLVATLAITYVLAVISAVVQKRAFASQVSGLGQTAADIVESGWNGRDLRDLDLSLSGLGAQLAHVSEQYRAYPLLQYYHPARPEKSPVVAAARLDDALTLIRYGVPPEQRPSRAVLRSARSSVQSFLDTIPPALIHAASEAPPEPDLSEVARVGIPTLPPEQFSLKVQDLSERRAQMLGLVRNNGWSWEASRT